MSGSLTLLLLFAATLYTELPHSSAYDWIDPPAAKRTITYPNTRSVTITWKWSLKRNSPNNEAVNQLEIKRYKFGEKLNTEKRIGIYYAVDGGSVNTNNAFFSLNVEKGVAGGTIGSAVFTIKEVTNQGENKDGSNADVISGNYTYSCDLSIAFALSQPGPTATELIVYKKPTMTSVPYSQYISSSDLPVTLRCKAAGNPPPIINWGVTRLSERRNTDIKSKIIESEERIEKKEDVGAYNCTASNHIGVVSAVALLQYTECNTGCSFNDEIAIEMVQLTYTDEYGNADSAKYKQLKNAIEQECLFVYLKRSKQVYSCVVQRFRRGNVVAVLKITYPTGLNEPTRPLEDAIKTGSFAGQVVRTSFVSPTSSPTPSTKSTEKSPNDSPSDGQESGKGTNDEGGLSTDAITALVAVLAAVLVIIIVVVVVWMLKRKKPAPQKQYSVDGKSQSSGAPLKPYRDPSSYSGSDDRYSNIQGPPPQYTSPGYPEVRRSQPNRNAIQLEWNKNDDLWI